MSGRIFIHPNEEIAILFVAVVTVKNVRPSTSEGGLRICRLARAGLQRWRILLAASGSSSSRLGGSLAATILIQRFYVNPGTHSNKLSIIFSRI